jgi:hypothetical protein
MESFENSRVADLVSAIQQNDEQRVNMLLELRVQPDTVDIGSGYSALHAAAVFAPNILPVLLPHCAHPDSAVVMGGTALSYVVHELGECPDAERQKALLNAAEQLLKSGAKPWIKDTDQSPMSLARAYNLPDVEELLLHYGPPDRRQMLPL